MTIFHPKNQQLCYHYMGEIPKNDFLVGAYDKNISIQHSSGSISFIISKVSRIFKPIFKSVLK